MQRVRWRSVHLSSRLFFLRAGYDTSHTRLVGKNSASSYVFCPTSAADAGKEVRIELRTNTDKYSGVVNEVYCAYSCDRVCDDI